MDDNQHALVLQLIQSLGHDGSVLTEPQEYDLAALKPYMTPKQQKFIDLVVKLKEARVLLEEM